MKIDTVAVRQCLKSFDFTTLFREHLGWDNLQTSLSVAIDGHTFSLTTAAHKRNFVAYVCQSIPDRQVRVKIDHQVTKSTKEHFVVYCDQVAGQQVWNWVRREPGRPIASRDHRFDISQSGDRLIQRLEQIAIRLEEEDSTTLLDTTAAVRAAFDVDHVTRRFYDQFTAEHAAFLRFIKGIREQADLEWYTSLMLNRLMFVYFIQKKGFLDSDTDYLRNRLRMVREANGKDTFQSFYRYFLLRLFHEGLGQSPEERKLDAAMEKLLGKVPYLNGGFFEVHQLEERYAGIDIPDKAFETLFDFFDRWSWHLDERPRRSDHEINPDVVGYIFEKYINQKQMGAYYTKEDITEYISKNTIIPFLFDTAAKKCPISFQEGSFVWRLLSDNPDNYIYESVRRGIIDEQGAVIPLPKDIEKGVTDVSQRVGWNKPAAAPFALPTETWREHVARRRRCLELRETLEGGQVQVINDLITLNLDLWQFAKDAIVNAEGPELLRAFWESIESVTVLDPTCGSGAFLFAALRILEDLYGDCLGCMERFVEDHDANPRHCGQFTDFRKVLSQIDKHPNERYFILKSIIIGNLFGVDLMEEAVEICKLRLFLKLVAQVDTVDQLEPLPDIDFNVRAGNSLVGYTTKDDARKAFTQNVIGQGKLMLGGAEKEYEQFEEDAESVERMFSQFRLQQTSHGGTVILKDKAELRRRLTELDEKLDRYLAGGYGIPADKKSTFQKWKASHQPFHWFVHFYGIMRGGGFDVIIGNPPYVELRALNTYKPKGYSCEDSGNLYALVIERCATIGSLDGRQGYIVPVSSVSTDRYATLQQLLLTRDDTFSSFNDRPSRLFDGLEHIRLTIHIIGSSASARRLFSTHYNKWSGEERPVLFQGLTFTPSQPGLVDGALPKLCSAIEGPVIRKLASEHRRLVSFYAKTGQHRIFYSRKVGYFLQVVSFEPRMLDGQGRRRPPSELKELRFRTETQARIALSCLNSSLFYWFVTVFSDCRNLNKRELDAFPIDLDAMDRSSRNALVKLAADLMRDLERNSVERTMRFSHDKLTVQCIYPKASKRIIDKIDTVLARHYGFTGEELDFIINYDIKYRVGAEDASDEE